MKKDITKHIPGELPPRNELLEKIFDSSQVAIAVAGLDQKIRLINPEFTRLFGYSEEEAIGKDIAKLFIPENEKYRVKGLKIKLDAGEKVEYEAFRRTKDGRLIPILLRISPIVVNGVILGASSFYTDISTRKKAEEKLHEAYDELEARVEQRTGELKEANERLRENEEITRSFIENIELTINLIDTDYNIVMANPTTARMRNVLPEEIKGEKCYKIFEGRDEVCPHCLARQVMATGRKQHSEFVVEIPDVGVMNLEYQIFPVINTNGKITGFIEAVRDFTEIRRTQAELADAKKAAEAANMSKSEFLANMSHEIRTPLNGIMGVLNLLLSTELNREQLDLVETGKRSSDSLLTVINDILDFSKIEAGELDLEVINFNLRNSLEEVLELPAMMAHNKGLELAFDIHHETPCLLRGDPGRLRQVILNITNNAIKFTEKGEVVLRISKEKETHNNVVIRFEISDTGIGIPADKQSDIFESFRQSDSSTTRKYGGTGLGLTISKKLVELMGGEIGVESEPGKGSTFRFTVLFEKQPNAREKKLTAPPSLKGKRFLLVDDNRTNLEILKGYLESWGCHCDMAQSGEMAMILMNAVAKVNAPFDGVILDMRMPGMDGAELGRRIKDDPRLKDVILIMLTSQGLRGDASRMEKIGFAAYLTKPIRRSQLFDSLVSIMGIERVNTGIIKSQIVTKHLITDERRRKTRILIAEDNMVNQKLTARMIEKFGFQAEVAGNGIEVLKALETFKYDIVLMDVQMPDMDGLEATRIIRDHNSRVLNHDVPIIAMTAHALQGDKEICIRAGMNDYTSKPVQPQDLLEKIEKYVSIKKDSDIIR